MIVRIVKMTFDPAKVAEFVAVFEASKEKIRNREGCSYLELFRDKEHTNIYFTYSHWENEVNLNQYRDSELFISTWAKTKVLFSDKPQAWSLESVSKTE